MSNNPLVSIIVRTKDRPKLLERALRSINAQTYRPIEVVLVNDGGCDLNEDIIKEILKDISLNYIKLQENKGRAYAGNVGIENAKGEYIGFLDDDDELYPEHLKTLTDFLFDSDYKVAYTDSLMIYKEYISETNRAGEIKKELAFSEDFNYDKLIFENYIPFMCLLFDRDVLKNSGGFDHSLELYEDWDLLIRIGGIYPFFHIKKVTANYNQWSSDFQISQVTKDAAFLKEAYLKVITKHFSKFNPNKIHNYMSSFVSTRQKLKNLQIENDNLKILLKDKEILINRLDGEIALKESQIKKFDAELKDIEFRYERIYEELNGRDSQINNLTNILKERDSQINNLTNILKERDSQVTNLTNILKERESQINDLNSILKERDSQINNFANILKDRDVRFEKIYIELKEKGPREKILYEELKERDIQINNLTNILKGRDLQINNLTTILEGRDSQINNLTNILKERDSQINDLTKILKERDSQINNLTNMLKERDYRFNIFYNELKEKNMQIAELNNKLNEKTTEIEILIESLKKKSIDINNLMAIIKEKEAYLTILQDNLKQKENLIETMRNTKGWRILQKYRYIRDNIISPIIKFPKYIKSSEQKIHNKKKEPDKNYADKIVGSGLILKKNNFSFNTLITERIKSKVSIIIPTKNAGNEFDYTLQKITQQDGIDDIELVIIDSGSNDETIEISKNYTDKIISIKPSDFHHAYTRNLGAENATGEFLVFTVQDAIPVGNQWLYKLIFPIYKDEVSAVSVKQIPRSDADFFASWATWKHNQYMGYEYDRIVELSNPNDFDKLDIQSKRALSSLNNVCLGIRKSLFDEYKFNSDYAEDFELGIRLLRSNHKLLFQSSNAVIHSHNRPALYFFRRSIIDIIHLLSILKIERGTLPVDAVLESISYLHKLLKEGLLKLKVECDINNQPDYLINSFIENFGEMLNTDNYHEITLSYPFINNYFDSYTPKNHNLISSEIFASFSSCLREFLDFMKNYNINEDVKDNFLESIYKIFFNTMGCFLGARTQYDANLIESRV